MKACEMSIEHLTLGPCGHQNALDFQAKVRPTIRVLRVCKTFHRLGARAYYPNNAFRFSGDLGWMALARFFGLIGASNIALLRDITIIHPSLAREVEIAQRREFYVEHLSPFGMADLAGYEETYRWKSDFPNSMREWLEPVCDPLETIRSIRGLKNLCFLSYVNIRHEPSYQNAPIAQMERLFAEPLQPFSWTEQPQLTITLTNLLPDGEWWWSFFLGSYTTPPERLEDMGEGSLAFLQDALATFNSKIEDLGWVFKEQCYAPLAGVWPTLEDEPVYCEDDGYGPYCDDPHAWYKRREFQYYAKEAWTPFPHRLFPHKVQQGGPMTSCVKCWRYPSSSPPACACEEGPTLIRSTDWRPRGYVLGNPGTPIEIDITKMDGENVTFRKSHVVRCIEEELENASGKFMNRQVYHRLSGGSLYPNKRGTPMTEWEYQRQEARRDIEQDHDQEREDLQDEWYRLGREETMFEHKRTQLKDHEERERRMVSSQRDFMREQQRKMDEKEAWLAGKSTVENRPKPGTRRWSR